MKRIQEIFDVTWVAPLRRQKTIEEFYIETQEEAQLYENVPPDMKKIIDNTEYYFLEKYPHLRAVPLEEIKKILSFTTSGNEF